MPFHIETTHLSVDYTLHSNSATLDVHETLHEAHLSSAGVHVIFDKGNQRADVEISAALGSAKALDALKDLRKILLNWDHAQVPRTTVDQVDITSLAQAIWMDLERATSTARSLHQSLARSEIERIQKAKWLKDLPNQCPLLLLGPSSLFMSQSEDSGTCIGRLVLLDTTKGAAALNWTDGSHWRDFRPAREDNIAQLATQEAVDLAAECDIILPDNAKDLMKRAEVISRVYGKGPHFTQPAADFALNELPSYREWMQGFTPSS